MRINSILQKTQLGMMIKWIGGIRLLKVVIENFIYTKQHYTIIFV
jgi:hypothetical protein